jgi:hypothetical protein
MSQSAPFPAYGHVNGSLFMGKFLHLACLKKAILKDVKALTVQKIPHMSKSRALGLLINYHDGTIETLGQWDPANSSISAIFDSQKNGTLKSLSFVYSDDPDPDARWVEDVVLDAPSSTTKPCFTWHSLDSVRSESFILRDQLDGG